MHNSKDKYYSGSSINAQRKSVFKYGVFGQSGSAHCRYPLKVFLLIVKNWLLFW